MTLLVNYIDEVTIDEYIEASHMDQDGAWGTTAEMLVHMYMQRTPCTCTLIHCVTLPLSVMCTLFTWAGGSSSDDECRNSSGSGSLVESI